MNSRPCTAKRGRDRERGVGAGWRSTSWSADGHRATVAEPPVRARAHRLATLTACRRPGPSIARGTLTRCRCASGSTSATTARTSPGGPPSPGCAPSRGTLVRRADHGAAQPRPGPPHGGRSHRCRGPRAGQVAHARPRPGGVGRRARPLRPHGRGGGCSRLHGILPSDIVVRAVTVAPAGFDARFSALRRRYLYRLCDDPVAARPAAPPGHGGDQARRSTSTPCTRRRSSLLGLHDFAAFCKRREGATTVRTLLDYSWRRAADGTLEATVVADAFCHSMVRSLVGAVVPVGEGRLGRVAGAGARRGGPRPRGRGDAAARALARGGRLPRRRRPGRPRRRGAGGAHLG